MAESKVTKEQVIRRGITCAGCGTPLKLGSGMTRMNVFYPKSSVSYSFCRQCARKMSKRFSE
jgi:hypothetical protein